MSFLLIAFLCVTPKTSIWSARPNNVIGRISRQFMREAVLIANNYHGLYTLHASFQSSKLDVDDVVA